MKLKPSKHPTSPQYYCITDENYRVAGGARWLIHTKNLPKIWGLSIFKSWQEALDYIETTEEADQVTLADIHKTYGQSIPMH